MDSLGDFFKDPLVDHFCRANLLQHVKNPEKCRLLWRVVFTQESGQIVSRHRQYDKKPVGALKDALKTKSNAQICVLVIKA